MAEQIVHARAVVAHGRIGALAIDPAQRGRPEGQSPAETEPDGTDLAGALTHRQKMPMSGSDVIYGGRQVELLHDCEGVAEARFVLALEPRLNAPEHVRYEDQVALRCELLGQAPHVVVDAEDLLKEEDPGNRPAVRDGAEGLEAVARRGEDGLVPGGHAHGRDGSPDADLPARGAGRSHDQSRTVRADRSVLSGWAGASPAGRASGPSSPWGSGPWPRRRSRRGR